MKLISTTISDVKILEPTRHGDARGYFSETYNSKVFAAIGIDCTFVQDNHARSAKAGTLRGLHFQLPPSAQAKLVRVVRGSIFDVAVDLRQESATFGESVSAILSEQNHHQFFVPAGFAHGYCTLEDDTEVIYKVSDYYDPDCEGGIAWNDRALGIKWPINTADITLSEKDGVLPVLADCPKINWTGK